MSKRPPAPQQEPCANVEPAVSRQKYDHEETATSIEVPVAMCASKHGSISTMIEDADSNKLAETEELLKEARGLVSALGFMLLAQRGGATRPLICTHAFAKRYPAGMRDNNEFDLVCTLCGKSF